MDSINNKVYATSEAISYTAWELFQSLMITLGFSVTSTTSVAPTVDQILDEFLGDTYDMWARENLSDEAMESNKQFLRDFLETEYDASAYVTQEIMSWLPNYVNSEYFHEVISSQESRVVHFDRPNSCEAVVEYKYKHYLTGQEQTAFKSMDYDWSISDNTSPVYKILTAFYDTDLSRFWYGSVLVSASTFKVQGFNKGYAQEYVGSSHSVYVAGYFSSTSLNGALSWSLTGDGFVLDLPIEESLTNDMCFVKWVDEVWEEYVGKDVIWSPTTQDVASDVALDWVDALEGVRDVVIPYTDALEDILAKLRAGLLTWEEAMEALNIRAVDRTAEGEQEGTGEAEEVNPSKPSEEENENTGEEVGENKPIKDVNMQFDLKKLFPFCIPFDVLAFVTVLNATPEAPCFTIPIKIGSFVNYTITVDFSKFVTLSKILRIGIGIIYICALAVVTSKLIKW